MPRPAAFNPDQLLQRDIGWLKRRHRQLARFRGTAAQREHQEQEYLRRLECSRARVAQRQASLPQPARPPELPISAHADSIIEAIRNHSVVIVAGETGSGKSTQLPKLCLEAGRGVRGLIGCTQPRRIAARSVARRVAQELGSELGRMVGFQVRFSDRVSADSLIKFMTDGILLAEIHRDRCLNAYDTLIIDEAHERSLNIDFLLGYLKQLQRQRPDLKIIITSATIDTERFAAHFDQAPVISVEGRGYPVDIRYQAPDEGEDLGRQVRRAVAAAGRIDPRGDILVFLPGEREIFQVARELRQASLAHTEVLPLYARLPGEAQDRIFQSHTGRRIVLATNVAETSLTVPGIRFVIDSGLARISRYAAHSRVLRLPVEPVAQASCKQRAGRCGRVGPGVCIRLYDEADFQARPEFTEPEIQRASLIGVLLEMLALKLGVPEDFPFIDAPPKRLIAEAWNTLVELGAIDEARQLTAVGQRLARLPVDARQGRMLIEAAERGALPEVLVLVAALSIADVRERPLDQQQAADQAHAEFIVPGSDFLTLLKLWRWWQDTRSENSRSQADKQARQRFLSAQRLHEWGQLHAQLLGIAREEGWSLGSLGQAEADTVHRSLLAGLLGMIGQQLENGEYQGVRGHKFRIFPGSVLGARAPGWLMAAELVETGRTYARMVAPIQPAWLEQQAAHLLKRRVFDPHWDRRSGRVMGFEQLSLHGLVVVEKRRCHFGPHDPPTARALFIRHALVRGEMHGRAVFLQKNKALRDELARHEHKRRKRDVLASDTELEVFFDQHLPEHIFTAKAFFDWYQRLGQDGQERLLYDQATLLREDAALAERDAFPEAIRMGPERFRLHYRFDTASEEDGITLDCPLHLLNRLEPERLEWLVPGLLQEKVTALIASLPKSKRRALVPMAEYARAAIERLGPEPSGSLLDRLCVELGAIGGLRLVRDDFQRDKLPRHLDFLIRVRAEDGSVLGQSRSLSELSDRFAQRARAEFMARQADRWQRDGLKPADLEPLPEKVTTRGGHEAWPAFVAQGTSAGVRLFDTAAAALLAHAEGIAALLHNALADQWKYLKKHNGLSRPAQIAWTRIEDVSGLTAALRELSLRRFSQPEAVWSVRDPDSFGQLAARVRLAYIGTYQRDAAVLDAVILTWHRLTLALQSLAPAAPNNIADARSQLDDLLYAGFLEDIQAERLGHYPRYLQALELRLQALEHDPVRDDQRMALIRPWWQAYLDHLADGGWYTPELDNYRWLIEEYRVQVFAQRLGTAGKVSLQRLADAAGPAGLMLPGQALNSSWGS